MSKLTAPTDVKYFVSCLYNSEYFTDQFEVENIIKNVLDDFQSFIPSFNPLLDYYSKEMGDKLNRLIFYEQSQQPREKLIELKKIATDLEQKYSNENKRLINIDIGFVAKEQVILATGKPYSHRVYLGKGIYAELTYIFTDKTFKPLPWTYPDYAHEEKIKFFNSIR